jgi:alpha-L-arabinofuranosidase
MIIHLNTNKNMKTPEVNLTTRRTLTIVTVICFATIMACTQSKKSSCIVDVSHPGVAVAPICRGQELEEFNHGIEGGLYAQMINNPSFEEVVDAWGAPYPDKYWGIVEQGSSSGSISGQTSANTGMLNSHQVHCLKLSVTSVASGSVGLKNDGFWGMKLENNTTYKVSFWAKKGPNFSGTLKPSLESSGGTSYASRTFTPTAKWAHYTCDLVPADIASVSGNNRFVIYASTTGDAYFDVVTIMPPTWKGHGCRIDVAQMMDSMHLAFLAYPGGFDAHWANYNYCRRWKESIGPLEERGGSTSYCWGYKNDLYFGTDEFFQLAEDLGAEPMYVFTAGIFSDDCCKLPIVYTPPDSMSFVIDDCLDFLEYCNGSVTSKWGAVRAKNGHPAPYNLRYVQIGAENNHRAKDSAAYAPRYRLIHDAIIKYYPDMKIAFNGHYYGEVSHPEGQSFWAVDDHFLDGSDNNSHRYNFYDSANCDPGISRFMIQEYCSSHKGMAPNVDADFSDALSDAIFMLGCEKNSERMSWTGYGNFGSIVGHGDYGCNLLWFDAVSCYGNPGYYMHKTLFGENHGTRILPFTAKTRNTFFSTSIDNANGKNDILVKAVNKTENAEVVDINLNGVSKVNSDGHYTVITATNDAMNSIANPTNIHPEEGTFRARNNFIFIFSARSMTVLRISL